MSIKQMEEEQLAKKTSVNNVQLHKNVEKHNENSDTHTRPIYGRLVQKLDRLTY